MVSDELKKQIYEFVRDEPKTIQEISHLIGKSWLTTQRYLDKLSQEGVIGCKTFRGGTRGALKIVFLRSDMSSFNAAQKNLSDKILSGARKEDFSASELYQFTQKRNAHNVSSFNSVEHFADMKKHFFQAETEVLIFSGNLSFTTCTDGAQTMLDVLEELAKRDISIKILCRVDLTSVEIIKQLLQINKQLGKDIISIRHCMQPLRADIIDGTKVSCVEKINTGTTVLNTIYKFYDKKWCDFLVSLFWQMYRGSIDSNKRIAFLDELVKE